MGSKASRGYCVMMMIGYYSLASLIEGAAFGEERGRSKEFHAAGDYVRHLQRMQDFRTSALKGDRIHGVSRATAATPISPTPAPTPPQVVGGSSARVYRVTSYGADPTGEADSTEAILAAVSDAVNGGGGAHTQSSKKVEGSLMEGIADLGGAQITLEGGKYTISRPLRFPSAAIGNLLIHGGTVQASDDFPTDGYLIDLSAPSSTNSAAATTSSSSYDFEYITLRDLLVDCNYRGGGIAVINALRTAIDNCYVAGFTTTGIMVQGGHETYIRNSFLGQHITAGGDPGERNFSGTAISLMGNDNAVTDVVIFSAAVGVLVSGQANILTGVHCYNKATGFGGTGIYLRLPALTQTRIVNCYLDYTGIVAEDPMQLHVSGTFFLGDAFILLRSINGIARGLNIVDNMFSGGGKGVDIVQLDESKGRFKDVEQVVVDRNSVNGMALRSTVARGSAEGNGTSWAVDFGRVLLFPDLIRHVQYSVLLRAGAVPPPEGVFPSHALRNLSSNRVVIQSNVAVPASVFVTVDQGTAASSS